MSFNTLYLYGSPDWYIFELLIMRLKVAAIFVSERDSVFELVTNNLPITERNILVRYCNIWINHVKMGIANTFKIWFTLTLHQIISGLTYENQGRLSSVSVSISVWQILIRFGWLLDQHYWQDRYGEI